MSKPSSDRRSSPRSSQSRTAEAPKRRKFKTMSEGVPVLYNRQRAILRGLGHHLHAVVQIGKEGISEGLLAAVAEVLGQHELIKLKLLETAPGDRHELADELAKECRAALVQVIGRNVILYRPRPLTDPRPSLEMEL